mmetsp:Transcript_22824/g.32856  ORF Transcript_22824/g.32856 Transcript_22824/m.32856 type:complete len:216 (-) Transcript_22824:1833-2480(-)
MELAVVKVVEQAERLVIDALPYVDTELLEPGVRNKAEQMVKDEFKRNPVRRKLPAAPELDFESSPLAAAELERIEAGLPADEVDFGWKFPTPVPVANSKQAEAWQIALDSADAQYQARVEKMLNLELLQKYGSNSWLLANRELELAIASVKAELDATKKDVENVNRKRKNEQLRYGKELKDLRARYNSLLFKNGRLAASCASLEARESSKPGDAS